MTEPRTLLLDEDEAPTVADLDRKHCVRSRATRRSIKRSSPEHRRRIRIVIGAALVVLFMFLLLDLALRQRSNATELRRVVDELSLVRTRLTDRTHPGSIEEGFRSASVEDPVGSVSESAGLTSPRELETEAASALLANDHREALRLYRLLVREVPREQAFSLVARILEARLRCSSRDGATRPSCP